jgi:hypothetical protein
VTSFQEIDAPDFADALHGWRVWGVVATDDGYRLGSIVKETLWPPDEALVARCLRGPRFFSWRPLRGRNHGPAPAECCECGIYAANLDSTPGYLDHPPASKAVGRVIGRVSLWGTVIECERGYRASLAYPSHIYVLVDAPIHTDCSWEAIAAGLEVYGVPVEPLQAPMRDVISILKERELASSCNTESY